MKETGVECKREHERKRKQRFRKYTEKEQHFQKFGKNEQKLNVTHRSFFQSLANLGQISHWAPNLSNQTLVGDVKTAEVENMVNGLHLLHLNEPGMDGL